MKDLSEGINPLPDEVDFDRILCDWLNASVNFHKYYTQLVAHLNDVERDEHLQVDLYIGQCPKRQLTDLLSRMHLELEKLIQDMDQVEQLYQLPTPKAYKKLAKHTLRLNQLNLQARTRLHLISQPTS